MINNFKDIVIQAAEQKRNECWGWVGLPEDYPLGYGEKTQAILEAFAERIRCPEASRSSQPNGNL